MIEVIEYFSFCPICISHGSIKLHESIFTGLGGKDHIFCINCGAKWHISKRAKWAKLVKEDFEGKGKEFMQQKNKFEFWQRMAYEGRKRKS